MISLHDFIFKQINKVFFYPAIVALVIFFSLVFFSGYQQAYKNQVLIKESIVKSFSEISIQVTERFNLTYKHFSSEVESIKLSTQKLLDAKSKALHVENDFIQKNGFFILENDDINSSIYTTRLNKLSDEDKNVLNILSSLDIQVDSVIGQYKDEVDSLWINLGEHYSMFYPAIDIEAELSSELDPRMYRYYYLADKEHNPSRQSIFIELFSEDWALEIGQIGAIVSPIYVNDEFKGVVGIALNSMNMKTFSNLKLPYDAYVIVTDKVGHVLVASNEEEFQKDFMINSFYNIHKTSSNKKLETIDLEAIDKDTYELFSTKLKGTDLVLTLVAKDEKIGMEILALLFETRQVGILILILAVLFILFLFLYGKRKINELSKTISEPINELSNASNYLADEKNFDFKKSKIQEIEHTNNNLSNAHERLLKQLYCDMDTDLGNKQKLINDIGEDAILVLVSLDNFRLISTIYGPQKASLIIHQLSSQIESAISKDCRVYRIENDVFAIIMNNKDENHEVNNEKLLVFYNNVLSSQVKIDEIEVAINYSIGYCDSLQDSEFSVLSQAELALEDARHNDSKKIVKYDKVIHASSVFTENLEWARKVHNAFDEDNEHYSLEAYYQAIFDIKRNSVYKFEMLVRMNDGDKVISPFFFLDAASQMGKLSDITKFMFDSLLDTAQKYKDVEFSVNTSFEDFEDADFLNYVKEKVGTEHINTKNIIIEILETGEFRDEKFVINTIKELKSLGFKIAIDDFGSGNSNFGHLMLMNVDYIKIDGQFIKNICSDTQCHNITKTIKEFAKLTGAKTIAEFVKDKHVFEHVRDLDIDFAQGYYISEPIPASKLDEVLKFKI